MTVENAALRIEIPKEQQIAVRRHPVAPPLADVAAAVAQALASPHEFPPLHKALTPDDHVAIAVDEELPNLPLLLVPILEHLVKAHITPDAITLLTTESGAHDWIQQLPGCYSAMKCEEHDPHHREKLSYLATTKKGRRVYLNRTAVDADQLIVLSRRFYDPLLGHGGAEGVIYPGLSDTQTRKQMFANLSMDVPGNEAWPLRQEAAEVAWLLGAPFFVQVIEGAGEGVSDVLAGAVASSAEGQRLLDRRWRVEIEEPAEVVVATVSHSPRRQGLESLARALACASRVVKRGGRIVALSSGSVHSSAFSEFLRKNRSPAGVLAQLREQPAPTWAAAFEWAKAADAAKLYLCTTLAGDVVEELFATPLAGTDEIQRVIGSARCVFLPDADRTMADVRAR
jgi:nickel-dependent lactate racemase